MPDNPARPAVFTYEMALRVAVLAGGRKLADQASALVPEAVLAVTEQPIVRGYPLPGWGYFFDVQAPNIQTTVMVLDMVSQSRRARAAAAGGDAGTLPVSDRTVGPATAEAAPNSSGLATPGGADRAYSGFVREALIDALLDSSAVLTLKPEDRLTIAASGIDQPGSNPLYQSRKLMLTISGLDLLEFRQGKITRDEAKARIVEGRF